MSARRLLTSLLVACCIAFFASAAAYADEGPEPSQVDALDNAVAPTAYVLPGFSSDSHASAASWVDQPTGQATASDGQQLETSGLCGAGLTWWYSKGTLVVSGAGPMNDFSPDNKPGWSDLKNDIDTIVIKRGVTSIGAQAFAGCRNLVSVSITPSVKRLGEAAFYGCSSLKSIKLPKGVEVLPQAALAGCVSLQSFKAPGLRRIESYAFQEVAIDTLKLPKSLREIETGAFYRSFIVSFLMENGNETFLTKDGVLYADGEKTLVVYPSGRSFRQFSIPAGVTKIADQAFLASTLKSVEIPDSVKEIGSSAFQDCFDLVSVSLPDSVERVGECAFYGSGLESVKFGRGLKTTSYQMFRECHNLRTINFGGLEELGAQTFANCTALMSVTVPATVKTMGHAAFGCSANANPQLKSATILGVRVIPFRCFLNQKSLVAVNLPKTLEKIEDEAFLGCAQLKVVKIPSSVKDVPRNAFPDSAKLVMRSSSTAERENAPE